MSASARTTFLASQQPGTQSTRRSPPPPYSSPPTAATPLLPSSPPPAPHKHKLVHLVHCRHNPFLLSWNGNSAFQPPGREEMCQQHQTGVPLVVPSGWQPNSLALTAAQTQQQNTQRQNWVLLTPILAAALLSRPAHHIPGPHASKQHSCPAPVHMSLL